MKKLIALIPSVMLILSANPVQAGRTEPQPKPCYFFRGEQLELRQTCIYESTSWAGGGVSKLVWEDGVTTILKWGLQGRGEKTTCNGMSIDNVCALSYSRHPITLKRISRENMERMNRNDQKVIYCHQTGRNSVCY